MDMVELLDRILLGVVDYQKKIANLEWDMISHSYCESLAKLNLIKPSIMANQTTSCNDDFYLLLCWVEEKVAMVVMLRNSRNVERALFSKTSKKRKVTCKYCLKDPL